MKIYHIIWEDFDEIVKVETLTKDIISGTTILSNKAPSRCGNRVGALWNLESGQLKDMKITKISKKNNPEYWL